MHPIERHNGIKPVSFFVSGEEKQVFPGSHLWEVPLSGKNTQTSFNISSNNPIQKSLVTIGDYFSAAHRFLSENDFSRLKTGLEIFLKRPGLTHQFERITLFLEKHGAFYHPLKIEVRLIENQSCYFVLNGAVSRLGLALIENEYQLISGLNKTFPKQYLPRVFSVDVIKTDKGRIGFFLGEWFEGYKEFHATQKQGRRKVVIWESDGSYNYISETMALPIYHEISRILTCYYDIETFEQIFPWHHGAGDFIVKIEDDKIDVRMITVRGYSALTELDDSSENKTKHILPGLLFFFLNLTLRIRLDRLNGTGPAVILGKKIIPVAIEGFLQALEEKATQYDYGDIRLSFIEFFRQFNLEQIMELMENILESCHSDASEISVIKENIESHSRILHAIFKKV
ncbi:hypothetical protein [Desulfobacula sp.]|uniref:hypothetical protein n=1 Tax=Desulfobacula sp. TaxID=2593537 RepID=UPI001E081594|nr:hypothetical protein [Desulfobacula sp.]MBT4506236.1 hypothetical protein [Desulfobacula sp.]MBT4877861.1 hypothetical protein [Desulfobacula sp.]MBT5971141.1 hypothetical protein [Desulfobacula sp.]MBT7049496.1 hypothetical protein [Desulfobacula sp.]